MTGGAPVLSRRLAQRRRLRQAARARLRAAGGEGAARGAVFVGAHRDRISRFVPRKGGGGKNSACLSAALTERVTLF